jgi:hypothetical protein
MRWRRLIFVPWLYLLIFGGILRALPCRLLRCHIVFRQKWHARWDEVRCRLCGRRFRARRG